MRSSKAGHAQGPAKSLTAAMHDKKAYFRLFAGDLRRTQLSLALPVLLRWLCLLSFT